MKIRLSSFISDSIVDGEGIRTVIFTQGCPHNCPGCHNQKSIPFEGGTEIGVDEVIEKVLDADLKKVTFSGGEPFVQAEALYHIAKALKEQGYNLWSYTGFKYEALIRHHDPYVQKLLGLLDIVIDGRFMIRKKSMSALFRGSSNQRIIDVPASLASGNVVVSSVYVDPDEGDNDRDEDIFI
ncbi:anaerobic ribonucleoside-triphosphate reductase activating protein [Erysipelothrix sp. HDW6C]|uniref:anaerobic ribonucleoside-triphosphate reductase activating protein n=1 Tax=Erysipelothrix sp. HDW6C TaxID=2714930 RepID=UPI00140DE3CF|nr:anaerobic ribonucleoside-triphosphate reductase activating protein [Erysipelothrix sp. HDW6C]QIK69335.1 anaerobic ribonucleoside-triphosphate reductase activating protein [Erysipelothrix sp. HDW6C]